MKTNFFLLIWFLFLTKDQQRTINNPSNAIEKGLYSYITADLTNEQVIKNILYLFIPNCLQQVTHRRKNIFSFNPICQDDVLYLIYSENKKDLINVSFLQRILLSRLVFKNKNKTFTYFDVDAESIQNPILIEVNNV